MASTIVSVTVSISKEDVEISQIWVTFVEKNVARFFHFPTTNTLKECHLYDLEAIDLIYNLTFC